MKTRQTRDTVPAVTDTQGTNSVTSFPITSSLPAVKNRQTTEQKRAQYGQTRRSPAYQRHANINTIKSVKKDVSADVQYPTKYKPAWERFYRAVTPDGKLNLDQYSFDLREFSSWLKTSPISLRELFILGYPRTDIDITALADGLRENKTITVLDIGNGVVQSEGALVLAKFCRAIQRSRRLNSMGRVLVLLVQQFCRRF